jgi:hypothetical protein
MSWFHQLERRDESRFAKRFLLGWRWGSCHCKECWYIIYSDSRYSNRRNMAWSDASPGLQIAQTWFLPGTETRVVIPSPLWHHGGRKYGLSITSSKYKQAWTYASKPCLFVDTPRSWSSSNTLQMALCVHVCPSQLGSKCSR